MAKPNDGLTGIRQLVHGLVIAALFSGGTSQANTGEALLKVLQERSCSGCRLTDADLVHADLRDADLTGAKLMRANLGLAQLDGADLSGADLSFTSLRGASLRGADLTGSKLYGTDLRDADLTGARLSPHALDEAHWQGAKGIERGVRGHAALHNAGVKAFHADQWSVAEDLFSQAILSRPTEPLSWVARGISRSQQSKDNIAASDFLYAASLYRQQGNVGLVQQLEVAAKTIQEQSSDIPRARSGNGLGSQILGGMVSAVQNLAPLAMKALIPLGLGF